MVNTHGTGTYALIAAIGFAVSMLVTARMIPFMKQKQFGQYIREEGPKEHLSKAGTPTMGGIAFILGTTAAVIVSMFMPGSDTMGKIAILLSMYAFGAVGFIDDYNKIAKKQNEGLTPKQKLILQAVFGLALAIFMMSKEGTAMFIPFFRKTVDIGILYIPFVVFIEIAMANAVNLTDGLDGLASSNSAIVACTFAIIGMSVHGGSEPMAVAGQALFGALVGFFLYNHYPAQIFMGDTGSMALGGVLSAMAIVGHMEWLLPIAGLIYVIEALSVIIQVTYFKKSGGKRVFRMAPIHHHFELGGWHETKVVKMFCLFTFICCIIAYFSVR
ncbi:MAG: phospho-N-acetylmuramoyl-pentapeptide-transferase [Mogibacterium sp.]|nr:phospho-N-acetylmuramoyl-pentapeptide-transferase [Mogibacterium sp.]MBR3377346.1 phospho-N-acetylmuramoyl-pentapeptide-transferase [Mogibacterium sp.]